MCVCVCDQLQSVSQALKCNQMSWSFCVPNGLACLDLSGKGSRFDSEKANDASSDCKAARRASSLPSSVSQSESVLRRSAPERTMAVADGWMGWQGCRSYLTDKV